MMKNRQLHTIILPLCTLLLLSCNQDNISPAQDTENEIRFQTGTPTRGLVDDLAQEGTKITLYGYHDGNFLAANNDAKILNGKSLKCLDNNGNWSVVDGSDNPLTYFWKGTGTYRFFGWLQYDPTSGLSVPNTLTYNNTTKELTIPETVLDMNYNQFDFLYSDINLRVLPEDDKRVPVALNMHHLFTAFRIGIQNTSQDNITIKSIKLQRLHTTGTATINFSKTTTSSATDYYNIPTGPTGVTYSNYPNAADYSDYSTVTTLASYENNTGYTLYGTKVVPGGTSIPNLFNPADTKQRYYMVWPQAENVIFDKNLEDLSPEDEEQLGPEYNGYYPLIMEYYVGDDDDNVLTKRMKFPKMDWEPGKKYSFDVKIADKLIELNATVEPWTYSSSDVNFSDGTIEVNGNNSLTWDKTKCEVNDTEAKVYVRNGQPVEATFALSAPVGGSWLVSFSDGAVNSFQIIDDVDNKTEGIGPIDGRIHRIKIKPLENNPQTDYQVRLKFAVQTADGKTIPIDDVIQVEKDANGNIIKENGKPKKKIYTIVLRNAN
ncbi:MAG: fimbrillin family protein [Bacteroidaceae bacterium]|nr:fimbrillin family protein [Bacteroidaceae bacterium]